MITVAQADTPKCLMQELGFVILKMSDSLDTNCYYFLIVTFTIFFDFFHHLNYVTRTFPLTFNLKFMDNVMETLNYKPIVKKCKTKV